MRQGFSVDQPWYTMQLIKKKRYILHYVNDSKGFLSDGPSTTGSFYLSNWCLFIWIRQERRPFSIRKSVDALLLIIIYIFPKAGQLKIIYFNYYNHHCIMVNIFTLFFFHFTWLYIAVHTHDQMIQVLCKQSVWKISLNITHVHYNAKHIIKHTHPI